MTEVTRLLRLRQVMDRTSLSRTTIFEMVAAQRMPPPIRISDRTTGWIEHEIEAFLRGRIAASRSDAASARSLK